MPPRKKKTVEPAPSAEEAVEAPAAEPEKVHPTIAAIPSIFNDAQVSKAKHRKCVAAILTSRASCPDLKAWDREFLSCVACVLPIGKKEAAVDRVIDFVVQLATQHGGEADVEDAFVEMLVRWLLARCSNKEKAVRYRATQLVGGVFNGMHEDIEVSDELFDDVEACMLERCQDKMPAVRAEAVTGLFRLQNPDDARDRCTKELLRLMSEDPAKEVRMAAISAIAPGKTAIRFIMLRARDAVEGVRMHALKVLREKVEMRWLSIEQRVHLLEGSLRDRAEDVAKAAENMLRGSWLRSNCKDDVLHLLRALGAERHEKVAQMALDVLLEDGASRELVRQAAFKAWNRDSYEPGDDFQPEAALCLRSYLEWLAGAPGSKNEGKGDRNAAAEAAPELPDMCDALRTASRACEAEKFSSLLAGTCTVAQLAKAAALCDFANHAGAEMLKELATELLKRPGTPDEALPGVFAALEAAHADENEAFQRLVVEEILPDVEQPLDSVGDADEAEAQFEREQAKVLGMDRLGNLKLDRKEALEEEDADRIQSLTMEIEELELKLQELDKETGENDPQVRSPLLFSARLFSACASFPLLLSLGSFPCFFPHPPLTRFPSPIPNSNPSTLTYTPCRPCLPPKPDPQVLFARKARCLRLTKLLLQAPKIRLADSEVAQMACRFVGDESDLQSPHVELRELAITCLGLHCHSSAPTARSFYNLFATAIQRDQKPVQLAALRASLDLLLIHSPEAILPGGAAAKGAGADSAAEAEQGSEDPVRDPVSEGVEDPMAQAADEAAKVAKAAGVPLVRSEDASAEAIGSLLMPLLELPSGALRTHAALGLCKLMHAGALRSSGLLARLLLVLFDDSAAMECDAVGRRAAAELDQTLRVFFAASGKASGVASALLTAVRAVLSAADGSRDANVSVEALVSFVVGLVDEQEDGAMANVQLAMALACESLSALEVGLEVHPVLPRALSCLTLPTSSKKSAAGKQALGVLQGLLNRLMAGVEDRTSAKHVGKLLERVDALLGAAPAQAAAAPARKAPASAEEEGDAVEEEGEEAAEGGEGKEEGKEEEEDDEEEDDDEEPAGGDEAEGERMTADGVLRAFLDLQAADAAVEAAKLRAIESGGMADDEADGRPKARVSKADGRRKLTKPRAKEIGLTPRKGENVLGDANVGA